MAETDASTELPPLARQVGEFVRAAFSGLIIETDEPHDAFVALGYLTQSEQWSLRHWSLAEGLLGSGEHASDPAGALSVTDEADGRTPLLLVLQGFHRFLGSPELVSQLEKRLHDGKVSRATIVLLVPSSGVELPAELKPLFVTLRHERPDRQELAGIAREVATEEGELTEESVPAVVDAAAGMTRHEAESACALSLVRHGRIEPGPLWELKTEAVRSSGLLSLWRGITEQAGFETLRGLSALKTFCRQSLASREADSRGVLLLSPPGCGKSQFAKALSAETGRPLLSLDIGRLLGSLVGESERNLRQALSLAGAISPCILLLDEVEKMLGSSGDRDSGVGSRLLGTLLTWMQERTGDVYIVMTSNDARRLPPELTRAERLDATFFVDLPDDATRRDIWQLYQQAYGLSSGPLPEDTDWTGAEIRSCCRVARLLGVSALEAAKFVVPVSATSDQRIRQLRRWASGKCLDAHSGGLFDARQGTSKRRSVSARPSDN